MLNFGNKDFRNLQEQVLKNMDDIRYILEEEGVLNEFGIKVVGQVEAIIDLPSVSEYKAAHSDWAYGDAYAVGEEAPYELYILTRANGTHPSDYWFEIGEFPVAGPQGPQGATGATGATPSISVAANTTTLSAGQSASVSVVKSGTVGEPLLTFSFEIPQGAQGIQGIQGVQGPVGQQGPQGIQGAKGDPGYLYTIVGQVNDAQHLPLPTTVSRDAAFLVGTQEPYDVYVMIGQEAQELEWINLGEIATVVPNTYVLSDTYAESGTIDAQTLATIINQTNMYYLRNGDLFLGFSGKIAGVAYYMSLGYDAGNGKTEVGRVALNLSTGAWTINVSYVGDTPTNMVTTDTTQTITGSKTFGSVIKAGFTDVSLVGLNGVAGFRAYKPGTTTQAGQMIVTNDGTVAGSYRAVIQAYNGTQDKYNTLRIGDTEGFKYYIGTDEMFTIGNDGTNNFIKLGDAKLTESQIIVLSDSYVTMSPYCNTVDTEGFVDVNEYDIPVQVNFQVYDDDEEDYVDVISPRTFTVKLKSNGVSINRRKISGLSSLPQIDSDTEYSDIPLFDLDASVCAGTFSASMNSAVIVTGTDYATLRDCDNIEISFSLAGDKYIQLECNNGSNGSKSIIPIIDAIGYNTNYNTLDYFSGVQLLTDQDGPFCYYDLTNLEYYGNSVIEPANVSDRGFIIGFGIDSPASHYINPRTDMVCKWSSVGGGAFIDNALISKNPFTNGEY